MGKIIVKFEELVSIRNGENLFITKKKYLDNGERFPVCFLLKEDGELSRATGDRTLRSVLDDNFGLHWFNIDVGDMMMPFSEEDGKILMEYVKINKFKAEVTDKYISLDE